MRGYKVKEPLRFEPRCPLEKSLTFPGHEGTALYIHGPPGSRFRLRRFYLSDKQINKPPTPTHRRPPRTTDSIAALPTNRHHPRASDEHGWLRAVHQKKVQHAHIRTHAHCHFAAHSHGASRTPPQLLSTICWTKAFPTIAVRGRGGHVTTLHGFVEVVGSGGEWWGGVVDVRAEEQRGVPTTDDASLPSAAYNAALASPRKPPPPLPTCYVRMVAVTQTGVGRYSG